jgi:cytidylate kinase
MIVTIDGPAASGKSTVARALAARLGVAYLDTGAMYRAVAHAALARGVDPDDEQALIRLARSVELALDCGPEGTRVRLDGHDVTDAIRSMDVSAMLLRVATSPRIRTLLIDQQRRIGKTLGSFVSEGRDQGSVVFPNADAKFVIDASVHERAERRRRQLAAGGQHVSLSEVTDDLCERDRTDAKQWEPLLATGEAVVVDTTRMTVRDVVDALAERLRGSGAV